MVKPKKAMKRVERAQAVRALKKANIWHTIKTGDAVDDVLTVIKRDLLLRQLQAQGKVK